MVKHGNVWDHYYHTLKEITMLKTIGLDPTSKLVLTKGLVPGDSFTGIYMGSHAGKFANKIYDIKLTKPGHTLDTRENPPKLINIAVGETAGISGTQNLAWSLDQVKEGELVVITYQGMQTLQKGQYAGKPVHSWSTQVDVPVANEAALS
jgi:hypothetical protein